MISDEGFGWWAVWDREYSEDGSAHVWAPDENRAIQLGASVFGLGKEETIYLAACRVSDEDHDLWVRGEKKRKEKGS